MGQRGATRLPFRRLLLVAVRVAVLVALVDLVVVLDTLVDRVAALERLVRATAAMAPQAPQVVAAVVLALGVLRAPVTVAMVVLALRRQYPAHL